MSLPGDRAPGDGKRERTAAEPLRGRTATSMLFLSALKWACRYTKPRKLWQRFRIVISSMARRREAANLCHKLLPGARVSVPISCALLLRYNLKTVRAYLLKESFQQLWDCSSHAWAGKFLDDWCHQTMRSRNEPMKLARSLRPHRELILNYFRAQKLISGAVVEGSNNKAKVTIRKSYGFFTYMVLELALYHSLGKSPEPESYGSNHVVGNAGTIRLRSYRPKDARLEIASVA